MNKEKALDYIIVIIVFGLTGTTTVFISDFIMNILGFEAWSISYILGYIFIIFPVYHLLLLGYAYLFRRFDFFYSRQKKIARKIKNIFAGSS